MIYKSFKMFKDISLLLVANMGYSWPRKISYNNSKLL